MNSKSNGWAWMHRLLEAEFAILAGNRHTEDSSVPGNATLGAVTDLLRSSYSLLIARWREGERSPSDKNWRWKQHKKYTSHKESEIGLEREICKLDEEGREWTNQVPTCSGLFNEWGRRSNVDLAGLNGPHLELIELKIARPRADRPEFAAREIIIHGLLYLLTCRHRHELPQFDDRKLLDASRVQLSVLAPFKYYKYKDSKINGSALRWMESLLDRGISALCRELVPELKMRFRFQTFPEWFDWPRDEQRLAEALRDRHCAY